MIVRQEIGWRCADIVRLRIAEVAFQPLQMGRLARRNVDQCRVGRRHKVGVNRVDGKGIAATFASVIRHHKRTATVGHRWHNDANEGVAPLINNGRLSQNRHAPIPLAAAKVRSKDADLVASYARDVGNLNR